jgi:PhnB protein
MASRLNPYVSFDGTAREALEFYRDALGGELHVNTYGEYGDANAPGADKIMHGQLETPNGFTLMVADNPPGQEFQPGSNISMSLSGDDAGELKGYWDKLSQGGTVTVPLEKQMWGDEFGMLIDRFGIAWMVNIAQPQG